ncbi:uncharacterized protein N7473_013219 [Penicillium subrubescens]|uniref:Uncharacterized protein n=1 Tax=Penicillium subrubescens TaxID=1316194 RepID=A0A1Q5U3U0_9EURO|nr:uncharacterized protein N7473_013219 [Penicillium subrubescens]KAJ5873660.1 hypothetical protein N7473_013219 [Penicillium subrubescens]OKP07149.1 hypothetical protein PENSUB_6109 [Penicillium subrubescens]
MPLPTTSLETSRNPPEGTLINALDYVTGEHPLLPESTDLVLRDAESFKKQVMQHEKFWWDVFVCMQQRVQASTGSEPTEAHPAFTSDTSPHEESSTEKINQRVLGSELGKIGNKENPSLRPTANPSARGTFPDMKPEASKSRFTHGQSIPDHARLLQDFSEFQQRLQLLLRRLDEQEETTRLWKSRAEDNFCKLTVLGKAALDAISDAEKATQLRELLAESGAARPAIPPYPIPGHLLGLPGFISSLLFPYCI